MNTNKQTHYIKMFSGKEIRITSNQADHIQEVLDHKDELNINDYIKLSGQTIHLKGIEGIYENEVTIWDRALSDDFPSLPEPTNRFTKEENMERMRKAAIEAKKKEQEKYGKQPWSTPIEKWLPNKTT